MQASITTAVDSLVEIIKNKGRISVEEASKELKLPENIINEWATFLEEEGVITVDYKFTTPMLEFKNHTTKRTYEREKELLLRKLSIMHDNVRKLSIRDKRIVAQKKYLETTIARLIKRVKNLNEENKEQVLENLQDLIKKKRIFDHNVKNS
ncbi:hypothetical protein K8R47_00325 [archaeon]|nr:hypothetical protein [archaeon]